MAHRPPSLLPSVPSPQSRRARPPASNTGRMGDRPLRPPTPPSLPAPGPGSSHGSHLHKGTGGSSLVAQRLRPHLLMRGSVPAGGTKVHTRGSVAKSPKAEPSSVILGAGDSRTTRERQAEGGGDQPSPPIRASRAPHTHPCWLPFSKVPAASGARLLSCPTLLGAQVFS